MKIVIASLVIVLLFSCQSGKDSNEKSETQSASTDTAQVSEYKPDPEIPKQNVTGDYVYVEKSEKGYTYCEFTISQLDNLSGELTVTLFQDKNETEYTHPQSSVTYPLEITISDEGQLQVRPQISDVAEWDEDVKKFPGLNKMFFPDGSGWPMQKLYRKERNLIIAQQDQQADSILLKRAKQ